ncbi:MAG: hypothetical protein V1764_02845 [Nitrospirota bacterium]
MKKIEELIDIFSRPTYRISYMTAKATNTCIRCGGSAKTFLDSSARLEYGISALCQNCQDDIFKGEKRQFQAR